MSALTSILDAPAATALARTLLHFLWQGAGIAGAFFFVTRYVRMDSSVRYTTGVLTLAAMLAAPVATCLVVSNRAGAAATIDADPAPAVAAAPYTAPLGIAIRGAKPAMPAGWSLSALIVGLWALGVSVFALRLGGGWLMTQRLMRGALQPVGPEVQTLAVRVAGRLGLDRIVRVAQSSAVAVPLMAGWLKPVVLFPAAVLAGLTPTQIEALLAHELAHVRRHDYVVNLLQSIVETLLFYHPAVWWVSRRVRIEREHCCDDLALGVCDRLVYATALSELAALSAAASPALAATGGSLLDRVRRIVEAPDRNRAAGSGLLPVLAVVILAGTVIPVVVASASPADGAARSRRAAVQVTAAAETGQRGVTGGIDGGVPHGIAGGVAGGVMGAVPGGVVGGVAGGVAGGLQQGVSGGVATGVAGAVPGQRASEIVDDQGTVTSEQQRRELAAKMEADQRDIQQRMEEMHKAVEALELERLDSRLKGQLAQLSTELTMLSEQQTRMKQQVDMGLLNQTELAKVESRMAALQQQIAAATSERTIQAQEAGLLAAEARQRAELARVMEEYARQHEAAVDQLTAAARNQLATGAALLRDTVEMGEGERIRAGDVLVIEIHGEPDVPRAYAVRENGTIKLPLSAPLRVEGSTVQQVQQDLVKQLTARGLERPAADVRLRRHRTPERR